MNTSVVLCACNKIYMGSNFYVFLGLSLSSKCNTYKTSHPDIKKVMFPDIGPLIMFLLSKLMGVLLKNYLKLMPS